MTTLDHNQLTLRSF